MQGYISRDIPRYGVFKARDDYLGGVIIHFEEYPMIKYQDEDLLEFQLIDESTHQTIHSAQYKAGILKGSVDFPYGFPPISNSKGRIYRIQIISHDSDKVNAARLRDNHTVTTIYQYDKSLLKRDAILLFSFFIKKFILSITNIEFLYANFIYLFPLCAYLLIVSGQRLQVLYTIAILSIILSDIFIISSYYEIAFYSIFVLWVLHIFKHKISSQVSLSLAFLSLIGTILCLAFDTAPMAVKLSTWVYMFLTATFVQVVMHKKQYEN